MSACEKYKKKITLYFYNELDNVERADVEAHLHGCSHCRNALKELRQLRQEIPEKPLIEPEESTLQVMRNALSQKIRSQQVNQTAQKKRFSLFPSFTPSPVFQAAFAVLLLAFGFLLGRQTITGTNKDQLPHQNLISANQQVQSATSAINPLLAGVEKIKYNPQSGSVEVYYTTINDIQLSGNLNNPTLRQVLKHAMVEEKDPSVRLHAVKALNMYTNKRNLLEPELVGTIDKVLNNEDNLGIRLQTLRLLQNLPLNEAIKGILTKVLFFDKEPAMRIQAFEILTGKEESEKEINEILEFAKKDTNNYLRYQSKKILQQIQESKEEDQKNQEPVKIRRKE